MKSIFVGIGNPGEDYGNTRHNTGRIVLETIADRHGFLEWKEDKKLKALVTSGFVGKTETLFAMPETFMNKSGLSVKKLAQSLGKSDTLIIIYDEIDLSLGTFRISYGRGDAGHNGLRSIIQALGTREFIRIRVGVSPKVRGSNIPRKPRGEKKVLEFLLGNFRKPEKVAITLLSSDIYLAMQTILERGYVQAMNEFN